MIDVFGAGEYGSLKVDQSELASSAETMNK